MTSKRRLEYTIIIFVSLVFFLAVLSAFATPGDFSDMQPHMDKHVQIMEGRASTAYPLMYYSAEAIHVFFNLPLNISYGLFLALCTIGVLFTLVWFFRKNVKLPLLFSFFGALVVSIMLHVYFPGGPICIFFGQGGGNAWLNPSFTAMKPFSVIAFISFAMIIDTLIRRSDASNEFVLLKEQKSSENMLCVIFVISSVLSLISKPSFVFGFVFAAMILFIIRWKFINKKFLCVMLFSSVLMGVILIMQFDEIFKATGLHSGGIIFSPSRAIYYMGVMSKNVFISIMSNLVYPIVLLALFYKYILPAKNNVYLLAWVFYGVSMVIAFTLSEGSFPEHLNMEWTKSMAIFLLNMVSTLELLKLIQKRKEMIKLAIPKRRAFDIKLGIVLLCLALELYTGVIWLYMYI